MVVALALLAARNHGSETVAGESPWASFHFQHRIHHPQLALLAIVLALYGLPLRIRLTRFVLGEVAGA